MSLHAFALSRHLIIFRPSDRRLFILNPTASWIWQAIGAGCRPQEAARLLAERYGLPAEATGRDLHATMAEWQAAGLDPRAPAAAPGGPEHEPGTSCPRPLSVPGDARPCFFSHCFFGAAAFSVNSHSPRLSALLAPLMASLAAADSRQASHRIDVMCEHGEYVVGGNGQELERTGQEAVVVGRVVQTMIEVGYPEARWMSFVHAAAGRLNGRGVVFPGSGGSGKSTLVAALRRAGWNFVGDDTVPLDVTGRMAPVPLRPCLKSGSWEALAGWYPELVSLEVHERYGLKVKYLPLEPSETGGRELLPVDLLVFPRYAPDISPALHPVAPVQGLQLLIQAQSWISADPDRAQALIRWLEHIPAYRLDYSSLDWAAARLLALVGETGSTPA